MISYLIFNAQRGRQSSYTARFENENVLVYIISTSVNLMK